ncbi:MAG: metallophosphoesterase [Coprococcus sp.]|jgi:phosphoesterase|uniref:metallophosphoesterase n=1 Tax=Hominenteromicrobium sp. TaxID=3073581 RepID=UPI002EB5540D|nr:metallophosphoesterase [Coprococcus sp.]
MTIKKRKLMIVLTVVASLLIALVIWTVWGNTALELNTYTVSSGRLPEAFDGYRIAHISDLHNTEMGKDNDKLLNMLREAKPDIIAITGDLIDSRNTDIEIALQFVEEAVKIAPCYYVTGNHEARVSEYFDDLKNGLTELGIIILEDERVDLDKNSETITLIGINDPSFKSDYLFGDSETVVETHLQELMNESYSFTLLLSHRPELFEIYVNNEVDLVLSGHAHGGQFRLPFVGGLVAPNQGLFPKYDAGLYTEENTNMIVSRGIGNSILPFRFNNRPEVILIELQSEVS